MTSGTLGHGVVVVGGGIVGVCCGLHLLQQGLRVTIIEREDPLESAATASCGSLAVSEVIPLSKPGLLRRIPRWLADPNGPLAIRPSSFGRLMPWLFAFARNGRADRIEAISEHLATLTSLALDDHRAMLGARRLGHLIRSQPVIELYDNDSELEHERPFHARRRSLGFRIDEISGRELCEIEPDLAKDFACAAVFQDWRSVVDTKGLVLALHRAFAAEGGVLVSGKVGSLRMAAERADGVSLADGRFLEADQVVVAAGAWSRELLSKVGAIVQMEGVVGYQAILPAPNVRLDHAVVYAKGGFGITPYESGLSVAGSIEFAALDGPPRWRRADVLLRKARRVLPELAVDGAERRMGRRPLTPDTLPIIDRLPGTTNVLVATGHGQLGLTLGPTTGKLIAALATDGTPSIDLAPYRLARFGEA